MTLPTERYHAVIETGKLLQELLENPRVPFEIKDSAKWCLRHYPTESDMKNALNGYPRLFQHVENKLDEKE